MTANRAAAVRPSLTRRASSLCAAGFLLLVVASQSFAAPPVLDYLYPAGGQRGQTVEVLAGGKFERWPVNFWTDRNGLTVKPAKESGKLSITVAENAEPGVHWIRPQDREGAGIARPFLIGTLPETGEREPNDEPAKAQVLGQTAIINGRLEKPGDVDVFSLPLKKGDTLVASVTAFQTLRSPMDAVLQVLSADGFVLEHNHDYHDLDPQIAFPVPANGNYLVRIFSFPAVPDSGIRLAGAPTFIYRLTLTTRGFVEYALPLALERGKPATVQLIGWNIPAELRSFPIITTGENEVRSFSHPQLANAFSLRLEPHPVALKSGSLRDRPQPIVLPVTITGRLEKPGDGDIYQFEAKKGQKLAFRIEARTLDFLLDPILEVADGNGAVLKQARATALKSDPTLDFVAPQDGKYLLSVRDLHGQGGLRHAYRLSAGTPRADFALKVAADRFTLTAKPLDIVVTVDRQAGFKDAIDVHVEGLPKTIAVAGGTAAATAKTATLRLTTADNSAFAGPIRIVGRAQQNDRMSRSAEAVVTELSRKTSDLWLTATGK